jgi:hypothetical protein
MKITICLTLLAVAANAETNSVTNTVIDLQRKPATFTNLQGRVFTGQLLNADLDGVLYLMPDGIWRNKVPYTNLSPATLEYLRIPTNRIDLAIAHAKRKAIAERAYQQRLQEQREAIAEAAASQNKIAAKQAKRDAVIQKRQDAADALNTQKQLIRQLESRRDDAWNYYIDTPSDAFLVGGGVNDTDGTRLARARQADRDLKAARDKFSDMREAPAK